MLDLRGTARADPRRAGAAVDTWLAGLLADAVAGTPPPKQRRGGPPPRTGTDGIALVAVGSLGRRELPPHGDLDLVLVHEDRPEIAALADALWYPVWDAGAAAGPLGALDLRGRRRWPRPTSRPASACSTPGSSPVTPSSAARLRTATLASWRQAASRLLPQLRDLRRDRAAPARRAGVPARARPQGGLRRPARGAGAARRRRRPARPTSRPAEVEEAYALLLDVRDELRRRTGRPDDVLVRQEQRPVAAALGLADEDALLREVSLAGRRLAFVADETWRRVEAALVRRPRGRYRRVRREPLAEGVVRQGDEVVLARDAQPAADPGLLLRAAAAAARADLLLSPYTLKVLAVHSPPLPEPWPPEVRWSFLRLLASGRAAVPVLEQLDQEGLLSRLLPEWDRVRSLPQRHPWHRFTVDRHLVEAAAAAAELTRDVDRPDLLLVAGAAARHRQGLAGRPQRGGRADRRGDRRPHGLLRRRRRDARPRWSATTCCCRPPPPGATSTTRPRSSASPRRSAPTPAVLQLLHALAQADGAATSASAWSPWKAHLVAALVARVQAGSTAPPRRRGAARAGAAPDRAAGQRAPGHPRDRRGDRGHRGRRRRPAGHHRRPRPAGTAQHLRRGARAQPARRARGQDDGRGGLRHRRVRGTAPLRPGAGARDPRRRRCGRPWRAPCRWPSASGSARPTTARTGRRPAAPRISWHNGEVSGAATGIVEVRAGDRAGLLYRLTAAITGEGLDVTSARIETLGADAVDSFYVCNPSGSPVDPDQRHRVDAALVAATRGTSRAGGARRAPGGPRHAGLVLGPVGGACDRREAGRNGSPIERSPRGQPAVALPDL